MCPFGTAFLYLLGKFPVVQLLDHRVVLFLTSWGTSRLFSRVAAQVCIPTNNVKGSPFSASPPISVVSCVNFSYSNRCVVASHCGFDLYFPDNEWCWASFHVSVSHLDVFSRKISNHVFCPFLNWIICFWGVDFDKFL